MGEAGILQSSDKIIRLSVLAGERNAHGEGHSPGRQGREPDMTASRDPRTVAAANGIATDTAFGAVTPPVYLSSTFAFEAYERHRGYEYSRTANPGRDLLADTLPAWKAAPAPCHGVRNGRRRPRPVPRRP